uniref:Uncharacterized protein n=1 Tax=Acrobeloides nanus TaxID=290746 RepID=A0A914EKR5_9BILA
MEPKSNNHTMSALIAGAIAGALAKTTIAPLDRTKINFQVSDSRRYSFKSAMKFVKVTYRTQGFFALFRGNSATMARVVPYGSLLFAAHEKFNSLLEVDKNEKTPVKRVIAGSLAGVTATILTYPLDTAKARLSVYPKDKYENLRAVFIKEYREKGILTFFRGMLPTIVGVIPYAGCSFFTYNTLKLLYSEDGTPLHPFVRFIFGGFAGAVGQTASYPLDIVRRRMQTGHVPPNQNILKTLYKIWKYEGFRRGLYKGLSMNWIKGPIAAGVSFTTFDYVFMLMKRLMG